jgi:hypothetical protein
MATLLRRAGISAAQVDDVGAGLESLAAIWRPAAPNLAWTRPKHHAEGISVLRSFSVRTTG